MHPVFHGLSEKHLNAVYSIGSNQSLKAGDVLFDESNPLQGTRLILKGSVLIQSGSAGGGGRILQLGQGDFIARECFEGNPAGLRATAVEPAALFGFDEASLTRLDPLVQLTLYKNLGALACRQNGALLAGQMATARGRDSLRRGLICLLEENTRHYENSETVREYLTIVPALPPYASRLLAMLADENTAARDVVEVVKEDPSLAGEVLKIANSSYYGSNNKITSFQHATVLLGFQQIYQVAVDAGVRGTMPKTPDFLDLQLHSVTISTLASELCRLAGTGNAPLAGTLGLLHDIGKSLIMLLQRRNPGSAFLLGLLDYRKIGSLLLKEWKIPVELCEALEFQSHPEFLPPEAIPEAHRQNAAALYLAHLCRDYLSGREAGELPTAFLKDYLKVMQLPAGSLPGLVDDLLLPAMRKKLNACPQPVRDLLSGGDTSK